MTYLHENESQPSRDIPAEQPADKCDCIERVDKKLASQNFALDVMFINVMTTFDAALGIGTHWKDSTKKVRGKKPPTIIVAFCPFCGIPATKAID